MKKLILLFLFVALPAQADFNSALNDYSAGNYAQAYKEFVSMAETGEKRSQFNLGVMYFNGQHVEKNINKSFAWIKLSMDDDNPDEKIKGIFESVKAAITDKTLADALYRELSDKYSSAVLLDTLYPTFVEPINTNAFEAVPIKIKKPKYPKKAAMNGVQGWVKFLFDVDRNGVPRNITLVESAPKNIFEKVAARAITNWTFEPAINKNGEPTENKRLLYTLQFRLLGQDSMEVKPKIVKSLIENLEQDDPIAQYKVAYWKNRGLLSNIEANPSELFFKSARSGLPSSQYQVGKSLMFGKGCLQDKVKGIAWLTRAASNGQADAKQLLATAHFQDSDLESQSKALAYLSDIEDLSPITSINLSKLLSTSQHSEIADPKKALSILDDLPFKQFPDEITRFEIKAAAYAKLGKFKKAIKYQEEALEEAEDLNAFLPEIQNRLARYKENKTAEYF